ncbi:hypothetical protein D9M68_994100 [compost metagenome]
MENMDLFFERGVQQAVIYFQLLHGRNPLGLQEAPGGFAFDTEAQEVGSNGFAVYADPEMPAEILPDQPGVLRGIFCFFQVGFSAELLFQGHFEVVKEDS